MRLKRKSEKNNKEKEVIENIFKIHKQTYWEEFYALLNSKYRKYTITLWVLASLTGFIFNGIFFILPTTAPKIQKDVFKDVIICVGLELPSNTLASVLVEIKSLGRIRTIRTGYFISILVCIACFIAGNDYLIIYCLLKFFISIPRNIIYVYGSELYDSKIRTFGVSTINFWRRIATVLSPFAVCYFETNLGHVAPYYIFTPGCIICFIISMIFLDIETRGIPLDEIVILD